MSKTGYKEKNMRYTKPLNQPLNFIECVQLLNKCVEYGIIQKDPKGEKSLGFKNNILVYKNAGGGNPEGWYSQSISETAQALFPDIEGQLAIRKKLEKDNIEMVFDEIVPAREGEKRKYIEQESR